MSEASTAIVLSTHDQFAALRSCLESLRRTTSTDERKLVVVDRGSTDGTVEWLATQADVETIRTTRQGVAESLNEAFRSVGDRDVVRIEPDVVVETPGWLASLRDVAATLPAAGVVGVTLLRPDGRIESAGRAIVTGLGSNDRHADLRAFELDRGDTAEPFEADVVPGALCYIRRAALTAAGGLDENYWPEFLDDDDFCLMARREGFKVYVHPGVRAVHYVPVLSPASHTWVRDPEKLATQPSNLRMGVIESHFGYWTEKWGWHPRFPDLAEIRRLYGDTEICWRIGEPMRFRPSARNPSVDVAMVTWNNVSALRRCLDSLARTRYEGALHVHICDNGSTDGTREYLDAIRDAYPFPLAVESMAVNTGVAVGLNWAIVKGDSPLVARLDDDIVLPPDWLETLVETLRARPFAGVVGPKILNDNEAGDIQCADFRLYPWTFGFGGEQDHGQADYRARTVHVRGCCNLYRRDVLDDCGLFDLRYSPSQWDDPDHHVALAARGYEVLYDGRVGIRHTLTSGLAYSYAARTNRNANKQKLAGKWGEDVWMCLDLSLDMSREGRILPPTGQVPPPADPDLAPENHPRKGQRVWSEAERTTLLKAQEFRTALTRDSGPLAGMWRDFVDLARQHARDGDLEATASILTSLLDHAPRLKVALVDLGTVLERMGFADRGRVVRERALALAADPAVVESLVAEALEALPAPTGVTASDRCDRTAEIGEARIATRRDTAARGPRVLMVNTFRSRIAGGDMHQMRKTKEYLERLGAQVDIRFAPAPDPRGYDLVHVFNTWFPEQTVSQVKWFRAAAPETPIVLSPIYWDLAENDWAWRAVPEAFRSARNPEELEKFLRDVESGQLTIEGQRRIDRTEPVFCGFEELQRQILLTVDHLLPQSEAEIRNMAETLGVTRPYTIVRNAAEKDVFLEADAEWFAREYGVRDFVLTVGLVEPRKNQLMLLHALKDEGVPIVIVGRHYDRDYMNLCRQHAPAGTIFIDHLPHENLASALKAARVFALPSWVECAAFASIEAAIAGCAVVTGNRTSEHEYYGDAAYLCDPASVHSLRDSIRAAYGNWEADRPKREALRRRFTEDFTWEHAAEQTMEGYRRALAGRGRDAGPTAAGDARTSALDALRRAQEAPALRCVTCP